MADDLGAAHLTNIIYRLTKMICSWQALFFALRRNKRTRTFPWVRLKLFEDEEFLPAYHFVSRIPAR